MTERAAAGEALRALVERIEAVRLEKQALGEDEKLIFQEAKTAGFDPRIIRALLKLRKMDPADREESEALLDTYREAVGMAERSPLHRLVAVAAVDELAREQVVAALKVLCPIGGELILRAGKALSVRRLDADTVVVEPWEPPSAPAPDPAPSPAGGGRKGKGLASVTKLRVVETPPAPPALSPEAAAMDAAAAYDAGVAAFAAGAMVLDNPFPWGDRRQARWLDGYRVARDLAAAGPSAEASTSGEPGSPDEGGDDGQP